LDGVTSVALEFIKIMTDIAFTGDECILRSEKTTVTEK